MHTSINFTYSNLHFFIYHDLDSEDSVVEELKIRLFVGNLVWDISEDEIFNHCGRHGNINYLFQSTCLCHFKLIYLYRCNC